MINLNCIFDPTFFRFILVGCVNTLAGSALMFTLYNLAGFSYWPSSALNYFLTSILSFFLNKYFTFKTKHWSVKMVIAFILTIVVSYVAAYGAAKPVIHHILKNHSQKIRDNISMLAGTCLFTTLNYLGQRFAAFRTKDTEEE
ncbi:MAG: GtrA family protein [Treponema sp.]|jgi:putative flippase GtrA|nr:GtrA family protein [Treponema sp.]